MLAQKTNEFSICLHPTQDVIEVVNKLRDQLKPSPYRDDPPHTTLVRGIVSDVALSDAELIKRVAEITQINKEIPFTAKVTHVTNKGNQFYGESGLLIISPSDELRLFRLGLLKSLAAHGFFDESHDKNTHDLHITIRLGIRLEDGMLARVKEQFLNMSVTFTHWSLFRLELEDGARKMHEVKPLGK